MKNLKLWDWIMYISLGLLVLGQITIGWEYMFGQGSFLVANILLVVRCFALKQDNADKIKNILMTFMTIGLMLIKII